MSESLSRLLTEVHTAKKPELCRLWQEKFHQSAPSNLRRNTLAAVLAHRIQEQAFGSLSQDTIARLRRLARTIDTDPHALSASNPVIKPGTRLVRRWKGRNHLVTVEPNGFEYRGDRYDSLSHIARLITGTRWSGPLFFGLRHKSKSPKVQHGE